MNKEINVLPTFQHISNLVCSVAETRYMFLAATKQLYLTMNGSVRPFVRLSVRHIFFHYVPIIISSRNFHELLPLTGVTKVKVTEVKTQLSRFQAVTPVWIDTWQWNDAQSLVLHRRGSLLFFKVIHQISRSHGQKVADFDPNLVFPDCNSSLDRPTSTKRCTKLEVA